jgi:transcriptional regulator with XRE-family HTH domain
VARVYHLATIASAMVPGTALTPSLRYWRTQRALFQDQLAQRAKVGVMSIIRGEAGRPLRLDVVGKLAAALGVSPADLQRQPPEA